MTITRSQLRKIIREVASSEPARVPFDIPIPADLEDIHSRIKYAGRELFLVGGAVRDTLMGKAPKDYDVATNASPEAVIKILQKDPNLRLDLTGKQFGVVRVKTKDGGEYEIATFREDIGKGKGTKVKFSTIENDVRRRDLTINALFYDMEAGEIVDYVGGIEDIESGVIRAVGDPAKRFDEDRLRILRAVRFAGRMGSNLDPATRQAILDDNELIDTETGARLPNDRITEEFIKGMKSAQDPAGFLALINQLGLFDQLLPGLDIDITGPGTNNHAVQVALILKNNVPESIGTILRNMRYSNEVINTIGFLLRFSKINKDIAPALKKEFNRYKIPERHLQEYSAITNAPPPATVSAFLQFVAAPPAADSRALMAQGIKGPDLGKALATAESEAYLQLVPEIREYIQQVLSEKQLRGQKDKRTLYHINRNRPARPQSKTKYLQEWDPDVIASDGDRGEYVNIPDTDNWQRWWLDSPVKSGVFLTPNPVDIAVNHGRTGDVYAYKVPEWVIAKSGGMHRYDTGSEVLIPEEVWNEAGVSPDQQDGEIEFLGKSMAEKQLWDKVDASASIMQGSRRGISKAPSWLSDEEREAWAAKKKEFNLQGLRATKHPEDVVKLLKPAEVKAALIAFEKEYPEALTGKKHEPEWKKQPQERQGAARQIGEKFISKKDAELIALLKKRMNESSIRSYIRGLLMESTAKFSGILKVMPDPGIIATVESLLSTLPVEAIPLPSERFHVTLVHQSILKPYHKQLKQLDKAGALPPAPPVVIDPRIDHRIGVSPGPEMERQSWVVWIKNQADMTAYINQVMELVDGPRNPELGRIFHITVANLTGKPGDSVR